MSTDPIDADKRTLSYAYLKALLTRLLSNGSARLTKYSRIGGCRPEVTHADVGGRLRTLDAMMAIGYHYTL